MFKQLQTIKDSKGYQRFKTIERWLGAAVLLLIIWAFGNSLIDTLNHY